MLIWPVKKEEEIVLKCQKYHIYKKRLALLQVKMKKKIQPLEL